MKLLLQAWLFHIDLQFPKGDPSSPTPPLVLRQGLLPGMAFSSSLPEFCSESFLPNCAISTLRRHSCDLHPIDFNQMPSVAEMLHQLWRPGSSPSSKTNKQINI